MSDKDRPPVDDPKPAPARAAAKPQGEQLENRKGKHDGVPTRGVRVFRVAPGVRYRQGGQQFNEGAKVLIADGEPNPAEAAPLVFDAEATKRRQERVALHSRKRGGKPK